LLQKLDNYLRDEKNLNFVSETVDNALEARSMISSSIFGWYAGLIVIKQIEIQYKDFIVVSALKILNDTDIKNFLNLYDFVNNSLHNESRAYRLIGIQEQLLELGVPQFELEMVIEKLKSVQALSFDIGGWGGVGNAWGAFVINESTDYLVRIIRKSRLLSSD
jgi:hypothetical protein